MKRKALTTLLLLMSLLLLMLLNNLDMNLLVKMEMKSWSLRHQKELKSLNFLMFAHSPLLERECLPLSKIKISKSFSCVKVQIPLSLIDLVRNL